MPIEIPQHLKYRAPKPRNTVANVTSRYKEPKQYVDPELFYDRIKPLPFRAHSPSSHNFHDVTPRYNQEPPRRQEQEEQPRVARTESIHMTSEYRAHKSYARASGVSDVQSHWHEQPHMVDAVTPRMVVEQKQAEKRHAQVKEGATFRLTKAPAASFGETLLKRESSPEGRLNNSPARRGAHSVVMNWINNGVPIPGTEEASAAPISPRRKVDAKPVFLAGQYSRPKVPQKYSQVKEEKAVKQLCETLGAARTSSPPRVAYLPPKNQAPPSPQRQRLSSPSRPRSTANNVMSRSPSRFTPTISAQFNQGRSVSPTVDGRGSLQVSRRNSIIGGAPRQAETLAVAAPAPVKTFGDSQQVGRTISPTRQVGGGASALTTSALLRRSTSPIRQYSQTDTGGSSNFLTSSSAHNDFLPFNTAPPPQIKRA